MIMMSKVLYNHFGVLNRLNGSCLGVEEGVGENDAGEGCAPAHYEPLHNVEKVKLLHFYLANQEEGEEEQTEDEVRVHTQLLHREPTVLNEVLEAQRVDGRDESVDHPAQNGVDEVVESQAALFLAHLIQNLGEMTTEADATHSHADEEAAEHLHLGEVLCILDSEEEGDEDDAETKGGGYDAAVDPTQA
eukprot:CAMPEP_0168615420 /NCGR_PEP_ID=MMETSP0449_2-20121227/4495_1 /TAXON_ID=1082188 /ORGANISM="Strombidium rassoulzadegani, Strain ras09" /LENGTH=189 /DNA_ID=CAMNT_0008656159 /DNA_START=36 /DNA_END=604 /DNA_ORIENTATION=+